MTGWTVMLRGIRYRAGRSLVVLALAAIATAATVLAPGYSRAAQQSVLSDGLRSAPANATGLEVRSDAVAGSAAAVESTEEAKVELNQLMTPRPRLAEHFERPVGGADAETIVSRVDGAGQPVLARLAYRDGSCKRLTLTAGECPDKEGLVVVSQRSAAEYKIKLGSTLTLRARNAVGTPANREFEVAGIYTPKDASDPYWGKGGYFAAGVPDSESSLPRIDAVFVAVESDVTLPGGSPSVHLEYKLRTETVRLDSVAGLRTDLRALENGVNAAEMQLNTSLPAVLKDVEDQADALGRTIPVVTVPLVLLCWVVLFLLVASLLEERGPEIALAKLRGYPLGRAARFGRAEALVLIVAAAPVGALAGYVLTELAARLMLAPGVHAEARWPMAAATLLALVAALAAALLAGRRTLTRPVLGLLRRVPERSRWRAGVLEGLIVALAAASLVVAANDQTAPLALLAPPLLAVVAGVLAGRMLGLWSRLRLRGLSRRSRVVPLLVHARLSRRPAAHRVIVVVTVAVALLSFAATAWDVAAQARRNAADDAVGATRVVRVVAANPQALVTAVAKADPGGRSMAVIRTNQRYAETTVEVIGVQSARLPDVAVWRDHGRDTLADLAAKLRPADELPKAIPVAVAGQTPTIEPGATDFTFPAFAELPQTFSVVRTEPALPRVGRHGLLFDLDYAVRQAQQQSSLNDGMRYEVWAGSGAPGDLAARLTGQGIQVLGEESIEGYLGQLSHGAPALGLRLYLLAGAAAVALAVGAVLLTAYVGAETRRYEFAALRVAGVRPRALRRSVFREYLTLVGFPLVIGLAAGVAGAVVMLPGIPLVTVDEATGPIEYRPQFGVLGVAVAVTVVGLFVAVLAVVQTVRRATPDRLREGV